MLVTSIFSFSHYVFYPFGKKNLILLIEFNLSSVNAFNLDKYRILSSGKELWGIWHTLLAPWLITMIKSFNPLPLMAILGSSNSAANEDIMSEIWTKGNTVIWLSRKHCGKRTNCSLRAISPFPTMFSKAVCCWCVKMSIYGVKGWKTNGSWCVSKHTFLKNRREKKKGGGGGEILITNIFSFSQTLFCHLKGKSDHLSQIWVVVCKCFEFGQVQILSSDRELAYIRCLAPTIY